MAHYFEYDPGQKEEIRSFFYYFGSERFDFCSDAGLFSTGHMDEGTDLLLHNLPPLQGSLLDLGCGWGAVGVVLGKLYAPTQVTMADINPKALFYAEKNCVQNGVKATFVLSDCFDKIEWRFDSIVLNPPIHAGKETVFRLYEGAFARLNPGGSFYIVIQKKHGAKSSIQKLSDLFGHCETLAYQKGTFVLRCLFESPLQCVQGGI